MFKLFSSKRTETFARLLVIAAALGVVREAPADAGQPAGLASATREHKVKTPPSGLPRSAQPERTLPPPVNSRPRIGMLGAVASLRKDMLTNKAAWEDSSPLNLNKLWELPDWTTLVFEERVRYESYATPWIKNTSEGQYGIPLQSVVWFQARPSDTMRYEIHFWDARQYGSSKPNNIDTTMVNVLNLEQIFMARIDRNLSGSGIDSETKLGQMQMGVGSNRLIGIVPFKSTQFQYVGLQNRLVSTSKGWELLTFANTPVEMLPAAPSQLVENRWVWNRPITDAVFAGSFLTGKLGLQDRGEVYFYYLHEGETTTSAPTLYTPGIRLYRDPEIGRLDYEVETIGQTGRSRVDKNSPVNSVGAIMQHLQVGYTFDLPWTPRFLMQWDYASSHFNSLFPSTVSEFGPDGILALFARNNLNTPGYRLFLQPTPDLFLYAANRFWWLADPRSTQGWGHANLVDTSGQAGSFIGQTWELNVRWDAHDNVALQAGWQVLMKGRFAESAPGAPMDHGNVNYWFVQTQFRF